MSATIDITCPHCRQTLEGDESIVGETVTCPGCNRDFVVPKIVSIGPTSSTRHLARSAKKNHSGKWWAIGIPIVLILALGGILVTRNTMDENPKREMPEIQNWYGVQFIESGPNGPLLLVKCERNVKGPSHADTYFVFEGSDIRRFYQTLPKMKEEFIKFRDETATEDNRINQQSPELTSQSGFDSSCIAWYTYTYKKNGEIQPFSWSKPRNPTTNRTFAYSSDETEPSIEFWRLEKGKTFSNNIGLSTSFQSGCVMKIGACSGMGGRVFRGNGLISFNNLPHEYERDGSSDTIYWFMVRFLVPGDFDRLQQTIRDEVPEHYL